MNHFDAGCVSMKYRAVIFDLFGTLVDNFSSREYDETLVTMSLELSLPPDDFKRAWFDSSKVKNRAILKNCEDRIEYMCADLGAEREKERIIRAVNVRLNYIRDVMRPRSNSVELLSRLREMNYKIGLISDCSDEVPVIWPETPLARLFDATVFSCLAGFKKPDPHIYKLGIEQLGVSPGDCLYIGDGGSQELTGALAVGMHPVLIRLDGGSTEQHLINREQWDGPTIRSLEEVLTIVTRD